MHCFCCDMYLRPSSHRGHHLSMQSLISILFWLVDIVNHAIRTLLVKVGYNAVNCQTLIFLRTISFGIVREDDIDLMHMFQFLETLTRILHLAPQSIYRTRTGSDLGIDSCIEQCLTNWLNESGYVVGMYLHIRDYLLLDTLILLRRTEFERKILKFRLYLIQTQAIGKRSIKIVSFRCNLHLLVSAHTAECAHVVQAVTEFDKQGTDIVVDRVKHLLEIVNLLANLIFSRVLLGQDIDKESDILAKSRTNILNRIISILNHIMQQSRHDAIGTEVQLYQCRTCHTDWMSDIRDTTLSHLACMCLGCQLVSGLYPIQIGSRKEFGRPLHKLCMHLIDHAHTFFWSTFRFHISFTVYFPILYLFEVKPLLQDAQYDQVLQQCSSVAV